MPGEREDTDPYPVRGGNEPELKAEENSPPPVDFDALHAALGDPLDYEEMSSGPALEKGEPGEADDLLDGLEAALGHAGRGRAPASADSSGRLSATYASSGPRAIPPTRAPHEDPGAPAVIVAADNHAPSAAPQQMTVPLAPARAPYAPQAAAPMAPFTPPPFTPAPFTPPPFTPPPFTPRSNPAPPHPPSGPHGVTAAHPASGPHGSAAPAPIYGQTPQPFAPARAVAQNMTVRMGERPITPHRARADTVVVRERGPSALQKLLAFMAMLLLVTACGIAVIIWRKPGWLAFDVPGGPVAAPTSALPAPSPSPTAAQNVVTTGAPTTSAALATTAPSASALASASASASASAPVKKAPKPPPAPHPSAAR
jgi:hypothetical protein